MKEIGGYIEFEHYHGHMLHEDGIRLNCGRNCLAYLIRTKNIKKLAIPYYMCDSVFDLCSNYDVQMRFYHVDASLRPAQTEPEEDEWMYLMSYYGQLSTEELESMTAHYRNIIIDFSQDYFHDPVPGANCLYTCRKFFGVPDGAVLYTDGKEEKVLKLEKDVSYEHMRYLLGRFERGASEFYQESAQNNERFGQEPVLYMSGLTENILRSLDYGWIRKRRTENFTYLHRHLGSTNRLSLRIPDGAFSYPYLTEDAAELRKFLISRKIFVPVLWPNVIEELAEDTTEHYLADHILPIPCDQRYNTEDMEYILQLIQEFRAAKQQSAY